MFDWLKNLIANKYLGSLVRHAVTAVSGFLLAAGLDPSLVERFSGSLEAVLLGLGLYALGQLWSLEEKKGR